MSRAQILRPGESYTFSKYFELAFDPEDILTELGCSLQRSSLQLPAYIGALDVTPLQQQLEQNLTYVDLTSEAARREVLISPILLKVCNLTQAKLKIEYPISVSDRLKGTVDYYLQSRRGLLIVEAKQADLARGFTQLAVELIAIDQWINSDASTLYGAVTTGDIWKFGLFHRPHKQIVQDINLYRAPADLETLLRILISILSDH
jgi:hypothetical protein